MPVQKCLDTYRFHHLTVYVCLYRDTLTHAHRQKWKIIQFYYSTFMFISLHYFDVFIHFWEEEMMCIWMYTLFISTNDLIGICYKHFPDTYCDMKDNLLFFKVISST